MLIAQPNAIQLLLPMKGANNGTVFTDYSKAKRYVYRAGSVLPVTSTAQTPFAEYGSSGYFGHSNSADAQLRFGGVNVGTGPFTVSCWVKCTAPDNDSEVTMTLLDNLYADGLYSAQDATKSFAVSIDRGDGASVYTLGFAAKGTVYFDTYGYGDVFDNQIISGWSHVEVSRDLSNTVRLFANGYLLNSQTVSGDLSNKFFKIGGFYNAASYGMHVADFAFHVGTALHTSNFTPDTSRMTGYATQGTVFDENGQGVSRRIIAHSLQAPEICTEVQSANDGSFSFTDLINDNHMIIGLDTASLNAVIDERPGLT